MGLSITLIFRKTFSCSFCFAMGACVGGFSFKTVLAYTTAIITFIPNIITFLFLQYHTGKLLNIGDSLS